MRLFSGKRMAPIRVSLNVRAFLDGHMVRLTLDAQASEGDRLKDLLKRLSNEGVVDASVVRTILKGRAGITLLQNGQRLPLPQGGSTRLSDGDTLSILTPVAGG